MKTLITGGAGFIGSHLAESLLVQGNQVAVIDDLSTGRHQNIAALESHPKFDLVVDSILDSSVLEKLIRKADIVFHLASAVGVRLIIEQPVYTIKAIIEGTERVLRLARRYRRRVLLTSSSEVYGKGSRIPFGESDDIVLGSTTMRRWAYACSKMLDEFMALAHWHETRLPVVCVRLFNTVGPRQVEQYGMVLPRFVQQALSGQPITIYGDGEQRRCFCHVAEAVDALIKLSRCPQAHGRVVNIGSDHETSINNLAQRVKELTGSASEIVHIPYEKAYVEGFEDMPRRVPDLTLAKELIGYQPSRSLDDIIRSVTAYWKETLTPHSTPQEQQPGPAPKMRLRHSTILTGRP